MARFEELLATVEIYQKLVAENYDRIRGLAEGIKDGMCGFMGTKTGVCVHLVPPAGPFKPKAHMDDAFSIPPRGFRPLGPVAFGLAFRVTEGTDWLRVTMQCQKRGDEFIVNILEGDEYTLSLPLSDDETIPLYQHIYDHVHDWFADRIEHYKVGDATGEIGFDFAEGDD